MKYYIIARTDDPTAFFSLFMEPNRAVFNVRFPYLFLSEDEAKEPLVDLAKIGESVTLHEIEVKSCVQA